MVLAGPGYAGEGFRSCMGLMVGAYKRLNWTFHTSRHLKHDKPKRNSQRNPSVEQHIDVRMVSRLDLCEKWPLLELQDYGLIFGLRLFIYFFFFFKSIYVVFQGLFFIE